jgi:3-isopropylmalate dehydrogenase
VYEIPVIEGDGVGPEVVGAGRRVLDAAADACGFSIEWREYPFGAEHYLETGEVLPDAVLDELGEFDAIYFGSVGDPRVEPGVLERGIVIELRFAFDQFVNLRPVKLFEGIETPLRNRGPEDIDIAVIRENTEDFYVGLGGRVEGSDGDGTAAGERAEGSAHSEHSFDRALYDASFEVDVETDAEELAYQLGVVSREGSERVVRYAFETARERGDDRVTAVDKANVMPDVYGLWREAVEEVSVDYDVDHEFVYADAAAMDFVRDPGRYGTVVTPNLFGDVLTDLGAMLQGGIGICPGGNINPEGTSLFEPMHGSAPDIAGEGVANPTATIWAGALLLDHLGEAEAGERVLDALRDVLGEGRVLTPDLGGQASTGEFGESVARRVRD